MPETVIVAGPNGAGKTNFARQYLELRRQSLVFVNADEIARELPGAGRSQTQRDLQAARLMLRRMDELAEARADFMIETTLAVLAYVDKIKHWRRIGYRVALIYIRLPSVEHAIERVRRRVAAGGHGIPEAAIRRRFDMSLEYLETRYKPIVDAWYVLDSLEGSFVLAERSDPP